MYEQYNKQLDDRLLGIEAALIAREQGIDAGLSALTGLSDPPNIRRRLILLIDVKRYKEAADLVRESELNVQWIDRAILVFAALHRISEAEDLLTWAKLQSEVEVSQQCAVAYADGIIRCVFDELFEADTSIIQQYEIDLRRAVDLLKPVSAQAELDGHIRREIELFAIRICVRIKLALGETNELPRLAEILETWSPLPIEVGLLAWKQFYSVSDSLVARLRTEHIDEFSSQLLAAQLEADYLGKVDEGFEAALKLVELPMLPEQREMLAAFLMKVSQQLGKETHDRIAQTIPSILLDNDKFLKLLQIESLLLEGLTSEATELLDETEDSKDVRWLQLSAMRHQQLGKGELAIANLKKASEVYPHPNILRMLASLASSYKLQEETRNALEQIIYLVPDDIDALNWLAWIYSDIQEYRRSAELFHRLGELEPEYISHFVNEAAALASNADFENSLKIYERICSLENPPVQAVIGKAAMLKSLDHPEKAFESVSQFKDIFWSDESYILALMNFAYSAGHDDVGSEAFARLHQLHAEGKLRAGLIEQKSLDDFIEFIKERHEQNNSIHTQVLEGRLPWTFADGLMTRTIFNGWSIRTQKLRFLTDDPITRAQYSIYSTNGYWPSPDPNYGKRLKELTCPPQNTPVVIDLSALITLHQLGMLAEAATYFGKIFLPSIYLKHVVQDLDRISSQQISQFNSAKVIEKAINSRYIIIIPSSNNDLPIIDEYNPTPRTRTISIRAIAEFLKDHGRITNEQHKKMIRSSSRTTTVDGENDYVKMNASLLIDLWTLKTIIDSIGIDELINAFSIHLTEEDQTEVISQITQHKFEEEIYSWHSKMWDYVRNDVRFVPISQVTQPTDTDALEADLSIASCLVSARNGYSLLADDRACQTIALSRNGNDHTAAFGTDKLLEALNITEIISNAKMADAFISLIRWRYRFLLPPASVLLILAQRYSRAPGEELLSVALYIHDCMRDRGLLAGLEDVEPPVSIAHQMYREWCMIVGELLINIWDDTDTFASEYALELTEWAITELLPSPPNNLDARSYILPNYTQKIVLTHALIQSVKMRSRKRSNECLRAIAYSFRMTEDDYLRSIAEVINVY